MLVKTKRVRADYLGKPDEIPSEKVAGFNWRVVLAVRGALSRLSPTEKEIVERFHFCGESYAEIGTRLQIPESRVCAIHKEARRKLKKFLGPFVQKRYGIQSEIVSCRVCLSEKREAIEKLLLTKTKEETWKRILRKLKTEFGVRINPRSLNRHLNRHQKQAKKKCAGSTT